MPTRDDVPIISEEDCTGCGVCIPACPQDALILVDNVVTLVPDLDCSYCGKCEAACPAGAISCPYEIVFESD